MSIRWHWGWRIATVYALFVAGTMTMVVLAVNGNTDLVSADYYAESLAHDRRTSGIANAASLGEDFGVRLIAPRVLEVRWPETMTHVTGTITLYRPSDSSADRHIAVGPDTNGRQSLPLDALAAGAWIVQVVWTASERPYYAEARIVIR